MKRTPLYENHVKAGAKLIDFGGWEMPVQYGSILEEHQAVRQRAGLFDVSHMGELMVVGEKAGAFVQKLVTNELSTLADGQVRYSPMCYPDGGTVDDILVYRFDANTYLLVVNASNTPKDFDWVVQNREEGVAVSNVSEKYGQVALQGPKAEAILQKLVAEPLQEIGFFRFQDNIRLEHFEVLISRTGYTGEDGFEILVAAEHTSTLWELMLEAGKEEGLQPAGLGARDTLRFEATLPLYGHELDRDISPLEAGLSRFVKLDTEDFIGRSALVEQKEQGLNRVLVGIEMIDKGIARKGYDITIAGAKTGYVTSGSYSPSTGKNLALGLVGTGCSQLGTELEVVIREKPVKAKVVEIPFYRKKYHKGSGRKSV